MNPTDSDQTDDQFEHSSLDDNSPVGGFPDSEKLEALLTSLTDESSTETEPFMSKQWKPESCSDDPITTWTWPLYNATNGLGQRTTVTGRFTVSSPDGCQVDWSRGTISGNLSTAKRWVRRTVTKTSVNRASTVCDGQQRGTLFDIDIEMETSIRISYFRLFTIQTITINRWIQVWADGTAQWA